jgi:hypothetical protein
MYSTVVIGTAIIVMIAVVAIITWQRRRTGQPRIKGPAQTGTAQVLLLETTGGGSDTVPICKIRLRVDIPGHVPYDVAIRRNVHVMYLVRMQPGATIPVQVDPANPQKVRIEFDQPIT